MEPWPWRRLGLEDYRPGIWTCPRVQHPPPPGRSIPTHFYLSLHFRLPTRPLQCLSPDTALYHTFRNLSSGTQGTGSPGPRSSQDPEELRVIIPPTQPPIPPPNKHLRVPHRPVSDPPSDGRSNREAMLACHLPLSLHSLASDGASVFSASRFGDAGDGTQGLTHALSLPSVDGMK